MPRSLFVCGVWPRCFGVVCVNSATLYKGVDISRSNICVHGIYLLSVRTGEEEEKWKGRKKKIKD